MLSPQVPDALRRAGRAGQQPALPLLRKDLLNRMKYFKSKRTLHKCNHRLLESCMIYNYLEWTFEIKNLFHIR